VRRHALAALLVAGAARGAVAQADVAAPSPSATLQRTLDSLAALPGARLHVHVRHLVRGWEAGVRADEPAPMASVYKLPIAVGVLAEADAGRRRLGDTLRVGTGMFAPGWSPLAREARGGAVALTLDSALVLMVGASDNTIADVLLGTPGARAINATLARRGVRGVAVGPTERQMAFAMQGVAPWPDRVRWSPAAFDSAAALVSPPARRAARDAFLADPRNQATPRALTALLASLHAGTLLRPPTTARLLEILRASMTGPHKLRAGLPPGTPLAHKTGLFGDGIVSNDVGLVTLPDGGTLAIAVLVADTSVPDAEVDARIALVARAAWAAATGAMR
jgi:beta-lactamase class A